MDNLFERALIRRIRSALRDHAEPYESGAWEAFISKQRTRRRRMFLIYSARIAATFVFLILATAILVKLKDGLRSKTKARQTEVQVSATPDNSDQVLESQPRGEGSNDARALSPSERECQKNQKPSVRPEDSLMPGTKEVTSATAHETADTVMPPDPVFSTKTTFSPIREERDSSTRLMATDGPFVQDKDNDPNKRRMLVGLLLSPSFGTVHNAEGVIKSSNMGAGLSLEVPVSSRFSLSSGMTINSISVSGKVYLSAAKHNTQVQETETRQFSIGVPVNIVYAIARKKRNLSVIAGISSYYSVSHHADVTSIFTREVHLFHETGGVTETLTVIETVKDSHTLSGHSKKFFPAAMFNVAFGITAYSSRYAVYEIQPYYQHPLSPLMSGGLKFPMGGVLVKMTLKGRSK